MPAFSAIDRPFSWPASRATLTAWSILVASAAVGLGCGTTCEEIARDRAAFEARSAHTASPHAIATVPFALANRLLGEHLARRTSDRLELPTLARLGADLGVTLALTGARLGPADGDPARVSVEVDVAVRDGAIDLFSLGLVADLRPEVDLARREVRVMLQPSHLRSVTPRLDPEGRARVGAWLRRALPDALGAALPDDAARDLGEAAVGWLAESGFPLVRDHLLADLEEAPLLVLELPALPLARVDLSVHGGRVPGLSAALVTELPVTRGVDDEATAGPADAVVLRMSGETAVAVANAAMARGALPSRFDGKGKVAPDGPFEARLGWRAGRRPLKVHLWRTSGTCTYGRLGGTPVAELQEERLRVSVDDGTFEVVKGPALTEAFAWTETLWGDAVRLALDVTRSAHVSLGGVTHTLRVGAVEIGREEVRAWLKVGSAPDDGGDPGRVGEAAPATPFIASHNRCAAIK